MDVTKWLRGGSDQGNIETMLSACQVSVRKAALGVMHGLLRALPQEGRLAQLWVQAALPMVRDVEASLQEQLLDQFHEFIVRPTGLAVCLTPSPNASKDCLHLSKLTQSSSKRA